MDCIVYFRVTDDAQLHIRLIGKANHIYWGTVVSDCIYVIHLFPHSFSPV